MKLRGNSRRRLGVSLMELLVVMSVMVVLGGAVLPLFSAGWKAWRTSVETASLAYESLAWMETLAADLRSAVVLGGMPFPEFEGGPEHLSLVRTTDTAASGRGLVRVMYTSSGEGLFERRVVPLGWDREKAPTQIRRAALGTVTFEYAGDGRDEWRWTDAWGSATNLPAAIRVDFSALETGTRLMLRSCGPEGGGGGVATNAANNAMTKYRAPPLWPSSSYTSSPRFVGNPSALCFVGNRGGERRALRGSGSMRRIRGWGTTKGL